MIRKTAGRVHHQRECAYCHGGIAEQRPVFLVHTPSGAIVGPYHAGCAAKEVEAAKKAGPASWEPTTKVERFGQMPREETLPW